MSDFYQVLNVSRDAEDVVIESAYRALMKRYHPDKTNGDLASAERTKQINEAYSTLKDPESRARYDRSLRAQSTEPRAQSAQQAPRANDTSRKTASPEQRQEARPEVAGRADLTSVFFIGLALLVGVGALGSLMGVGADTSADGATVETEAAVASGAEEPHRASGDRGPGDPQVRDTGRESTVAGQDNAADLTASRDADAVKDGAKQKEPLAAGQEMGPQSAEQVLDDVEGLF